MKPHKKSFIFCIVVIITRFCENIVYIIPCFKLKSISRIIVMCSVFVPPCSYIVKLKCQTVISLCLDAYVWKKGTPVQSVCT